MKKLNFAAIDMGTNAVRMLIKGTDQPGSDVLLSKEFLIRVPLRLGQEVFTSGHIPASKIRKLIQLIQSFKLLMEIYEVVDFRACATSAMRDADNGKEITRQILDETGVSVDIIDGKTEASIIYNSHICDIFYEKRNFIFADVGGGSTEITIIHNGELISSHSYDIGTVRSLNNKVDQRVMKAFYRDLKKIPEIDRQFSIIGIGGNINKLFRLAEIEIPHPLPVSRLQKIYRMLQSKSLKERISELKLKPDRADVIIPASEIYLDIARHTGATEIYVPTIGIADGITQSLYSEYMRKKISPTIYLENK